MPAERRPERQRSQVRDSDEGRHEVLLHLARLDPRPTSSARKTRSTTRSTCCRSIVSRRTHNPVAGPPARSPPAPPAAHKPPFLRRRAECLRQRPVAVASAVDRSETAELVAAGASRCSGRWVESLVGRHTGRVAGVKVAACCSIRPASGGCRSGGDSPGRAVVGESQGDESAQVERGGAVVEPVVVLGGAAVAQCVGCRG